MAFGTWDAALVVGVSAQATALAYAFHPQLKALIMTLPIPFSLATLALARPVDATHMLGLLLLLGYAQCVRVCHQALGLPIVGSILIGAVGYCLCGWGVAAWIPTTDGAFWVSAALVLITGCGLLWWLPARVEPGYRTTLPLYCKWPIVVGVVLALIAAKDFLQGAFTLFPMVGVIASYESRHSLWTLARQVPVIMLSLLPLLVTLHVVGQRWNAGFALLLGWAFFGLTLPVATRVRDWRDHTRVAIGS